MYTRNWLYGALSCVFMCSLYAQQTASRPAFTMQGSVTHGNSESTVVSNDPRPLNQAVEAVRKEYGWIIDFEDPSYGHMDLVDDTDPQWRTLHPSAKGVTRIRGGAFTSTFPRVQDRRNGSVDERVVLEQLVSDYNSSTNPGRFVVKKEGPGRFALVGIKVRSSNGLDTPVVSPLDINVSFGSADRSLTEVIDLILNQISARSRIKIVLGTAPANALIKSRSSIDARDIPARQVLAAILSSTKHPIVWQLFYDADSSSYFLNLSYATKLQYDPLLGQKEALLATER